MAFILRSFLHATFSNSAFLYMTVFFVLGPWTRQMLTIGANVLVKIQVLLRPSITPVSFTSLCFQQVIGIKNSLLWTSTFIAWEY